MTPALYRAPEPVSGGCSLCARSVVALTNTYGAQYTPTLAFVVAPSYAGPGQEYVTVKNTSNFTWNSTNVNLSYHLYNSAQTLINYQGLFTYLPAAVTVPPNSTYSFLANVEELPQGSYLMVWDMEMQDGSGWFTDFGVPASTAVPFSVPHYPPTIQLALPRNGATINTLNPVFEVDVAADWTYTPSVDLQVCRGTDGIIGGQCVDSGWQQVILPQGVFGNSFLWHAPAGSFSWNQAYSWQAAVRDSGSTGPWSDVNVFSPRVGDSGPLENMGANSTSVDPAGVNYLTHAYFRQDNDASVPTASVPLQIARTYNSGDTRVGAFGKGWSSVLDMAAGPLEASTLDPSEFETFVRYADGKTTGYGRNADGSYTSAFGSGAAAAVNSWDDITLPNGDDYHFGDFDNTGSGAAHITSITAANGGATTFTVDQYGRVTSMTDVESGRSLLMTWGALNGAAVSRVDVAFNGSVAASWTYSYDGNGYLHQVCDPNTSTRCTTYTVDGSGRLTQITPGRGSASATTVAYVGSTTTVDHVTLPASATGDPAPVWQYSWSNTFVATAAPDLLGEVDTVLSPNGLYHFFNFDPVSGQMRQEWWESTSQSGAPHLAPTEADSRVYLYDAGGRPESMVDENGNESVWDYFPDGQLADKWQYTNNQGTEALTHYSYNLAASPRWQRQLVTETDAGTSNQTFYTYDGSGILRTKTLPATSSSPSGTTTTYRYTCDNGSAPAAVHNYTGAASTQPCDLLASVTDPAGLVTAYAYDGAGDLTRTTTPAGLVTDVYYDQYGRATKKLVTNAPSTSAAETDYSYNPTNQMIGELDPPVTNAVTGFVHQMSTSYYYDLDGNLTSKYVADTGNTDAGGDLGRLYTYGYDNADRLTTSANNGVVTDQVTYDGVGAVTSSKAARGSTINFTYNPQGLLYQATTVVEGGRNVTLDTYNYDPAGRLLATTDAMGSTVVRTYTPDNLLLTEDLETGPAQGGLIPVVILHNYTYDQRRNVNGDTAGATGTVNATTAVVTATSAGRTTTFSYDNADRLLSSTLDPGSGHLNRVTNTSYDAAGRASTSTLSQGSYTQSNTLSYNSSGLVASNSVANGTPGPLVTFFGGYTGAGQPQGVQDPRGNITYASYDIAGRLSSTAQPSVTLQDGTASTPTTGTPTEVRGYDTFGELTDVKSPNGDVTHTTYDQGGRKVRVDYPAYASPAGGILAPYETWTYDGNNNVTSHTDRNGKTTTYTYDPRNRLTTVTGPPPASDASAPVTQYAYDDAGNLLSVIDPTGAQTLYGYDAFERPTTKTQVVRHPSSGSTMQITSYGYDTFGDVTSVTSPAEQVSATYDAAGELSSATVTGRGTETFSYDAAGHLVRSTDFSGRITTNSYDPAGRQTANAVLNPAGTIVLTAQSYTLDANGNNTAVTDARGNVWNATYDADNRQTTLLDPAPTSPAGTVLPRPTTVFGYDADGNRTAVTDARGNSTYQTYNSWDLPDTRVEPSTTGQSSPTWKTAYNAAGAISMTLAPGGVTVTYTYDDLGRLTEQDGAGGGAASASRKFGYDLDNRLAGISTPTTNELFSYDDRGFLTSATGPEGAATTNTYSGTAPLLQQTVDGSGTTNYAYNPGTPDVATASDSMTGTSRAYTYTPDGAIDHETDTVSGTAVSLRDYSYDALGRTASDTLYNASAQITAQTTETWDPAGNLLSLATGGQLANPHTDSYGYDTDNRLITDITNTGSTTTAQAFTWDGAGNRVNRTNGTCSNSTCSSGITFTGSTDYSYDARNRVATATASTPSAGTTSTTTYAWSPRGTLASMSTTPTGGTTSTSNATFDSLDRLINLAGVTYYYDSLDRIAARTANSTTNTFAYNGVGLEPVVDNVTATSRDQDGNPVAASVGGTAGNLLTVPHGDVIAATNPANASIAGTKNYNPFGNITNQTGTLPALGFQGSYTDSASGLVHAQSRWYAPTLGAFISEDTQPPATTNAASNNHYLYADANPASNNDPTGNLGNPLGTAWKWTAESFDSFGSAAAGVAEEAGPAVLAGVEAAAPEAAEGVAGAACFGSGACEAALVVAAVGTAGYAAYELANRISSNGSAPTPAPTLTMPAPRVVPTRTVLGKPLTVGKPQVSVSKWYDDTYAYTRTDTYTYTTAYKYTYFSNGSITTQKINGNSDRWEIVSQLLIDLNHTTAAIPEAIPGAPQQPADAPAASTSGTCGQGRAMSACNPVGAGGLPKGSLKRFQQADEHTGSCDSPSAPGTELDLTAITLRDCDHANQPATGSSGTNGRTPGTPSVTAGCDLADHKCTAKPVAGLADSGLVNPSTIRFSQNSIGGAFKNGGSVKELAADLRSGAVDPSDIPAIRLVQKNGNFYTLDNRRLAAFQEAGLDVPYRMASAQEIASEGWKFTTTNDGTSVLIRGGG